jgi:hypothetical protein
LNGLYKVLAIVLFPLILVVGLIIILFAGLLSIWQTITSTKEEREKNKQEKIRLEGLKTNWGFFYKNDKVKIEEQLAGSLPRDSGDYLHLRSTPTIPYLTQKIFGDWFLVDFDGIFLQKWNNTNDINCDLIFVEFASLNVAVIKAKIPSKDWTTEKLDKNEIKFTFMTENEDLIFLVTQQELFDQNVNP